MNELLIISPIAAFLLSYVLLPVFRKIAFKIGLVDKPNHRKVHQNQIPLIGGVSIFIATSLALFLAIPFDIKLLAFKNVFIATFIILIMGVIDDRYDIKASLRLSIQLILAHFIFEQGIKIESLHGLLGVYELVPLIQYTLTVLVIVGVVNAINLMDGIDGLAAGLALVGFLIFTVISILIGKSILALIFLTLIGSILAFLRYNLSKKQKIFLGDAGSMMLGFILAVAGVSLLQFTQSTAYLTITAMGVIAVFIVPVLDALRVFRRRVKSGKSPFSPDKTHLHHLILDIGLKHKIASVAIIFMVAFIMVFGYLTFSFLGLTFSVAMMLILFYLIISILQFNNKLKHWKRHILLMEKNEVVR